ncbi:MAG: hypothetical protein WCR51_01800 [Planctomycetia bacterium]
MRNDNLRIAISGPNASGKTTLAKAISKKFAIPMIEEDLGVLFGAQKKLDQLRSQSAPQEEVKSALGRWQECFFEWAKSREAAYSKYDSFVADRWEADLLDIWLVLMRRLENIDPQTVRLVRHLKAVAARMSFAILMPIAKPLSDVPNDAGLVRVASFSNRLLNSMTTAGIIFSLPNLNVLRMPAGLSSTDDQIKIVESAWSKDRTVNDTSASV